MRLLIAGECFSPNLGDPLLCRSLERMLCAGREDVELTMLDISGRRPFGDVANVRSAPGRGILARALPSRLLAEAAWVRGHRRLREKFRAAVGEVDAMVVPGGQLFMDNWLSFPRRLALLFEEVERRRIPAAIWACGVYGDLSPRALTLLSSVAHSPALAYLGVRDSASAAKAVLQFGVTPIVNPDPALAWLSGRWLDGRSRSAAGPVAVAVMDPARAARHRLDSPTVIDNLFRGLLERCPPGSIVFGNGEMRDWEYQARLWRSLPAPVRDRLDWVERLVEPDQLVATIERAGEVYCARLHAAIPGWALGRPTWMLRGDSKSEAIMRDLGLPDESSDGVLGWQPAFRGGRWSGQPELVRRARVGVGDLLSRLDEAATAPSRLP